MAHKIAGTADGKEAENLRARMESLEGDNKRHIEANRKLSARANGISMPSSKKKAIPVRQAGPRGKRPRSTRPDKVDCTEIVDFDRCPGCGSQNVSEKPTAVRPDRQEAGSDCDGKVRDSQALVQGLQETGLCQAARNRAARPLRLPTSAPCSTF